MEPINARRLHRHPFSFPLSATRQRSSPHGGGDETKASQSPHFFPPRCLLQPTTLTRCSTSQTRIEWNVSDATRAESSLFPRLLCLLHYPTSPTTSWACVYLPTFLTQPNPPYSFVICASVQKLNRHLICAMLGTQYKLILYSFFLSNQCMRMRAKWRICMKTIWMLFFGGV